MFIAFAATITKAGNVSRVIVFAALLVAVVNWCVGKCVVCAVLRTYDFE